jgi:UDP:flavonoid glycosyltransferase YjiC (YdhE family)
MRVLLVSFGALGDILPFVGWGRALGERGHEVFLLASGNARALAERAGLSFVTLDLDEEGIPPRAPSSFRLLRRFVAEFPQLMRRVYQAVAASHAPGHTVVAAQGWLCGARIAQEHLGVPLASVHLQPLMFGDLDEPDGLPRRLTCCRARLQQRLVRKGLNWLFGRSVNDFRRTLGLPPVRGIGDWYCSPQLIVGMFPPWFSPPRPDWPRQTILAGFPRFDGFEEPHHRDELDAFLAQGSPPLVFTHFSLLKAGTDYFQTSAEIAQRLGRRAILLSAQAEQPAAPLPDGVRHFGFVPLSRVLPRAAALVHHGGIGTLSQALAAGVPQLVVPLFLDHPDNCRRLARLGVSATIRPRHYRVDLVVDKLKHLLESADVQQRCRHYAELCRQDDGYDVACSALESLVVSKELAAAKKGDP